MWGEAKDFGGGMVDVGTGAAKGLWGAGQVAAAPVTGPLESAYDGATGWFGGVLDDVVESRLPDTSNYVTHPELSTSQTQQDEAAAAATGNTAPAVQMPGGWTRYYPENAADVKAIQTALGVNVDGAFGPSTHAAWNNANLGALPATSADAKAKAGSLANDHVTARYRQNQLRKSAGLTVQDKIDLLARQFTSGVPSNIRR